MKFTKIFLFTLLAIFSLGFIYNEAQAACINTSTTACDSVTVTVTTADTSTSAPSTPANLTVTASYCSNNWLNISWKASTGATSYQVYRDEGVTAIYDGALLAFSDTSLTLGSTHTYKVKATNAGGSSALSPTSTSVAVSSICKITFNKNGGTNDANPTYKEVATYNTSVGTLPTEPTKNGSTFLSWNTLADGTGSTFTASTLVTNIYTVYAKWESNLTITATAGPGGLITTIETSPYCKALSTNGNIRTYEKDCSALYNIIPDAIHDIKNIYFDNVLRYSIFIVPDSFSYSRSVSTYVSSGNPSLILTDYRKSAVSIYGDVKYHSSAQATFKMDKDHTIKVDFACLNNSTELDTCERVGTERVGTTPSIPTDLSADTSTTPSSCGNNWLNISWNASTGATSYQVYRDEGATAIYNSSALFFSDTGLTLGSTHTYKVRATNAGGSSALSSSVSGTVANVCAFTLTYFANTGGSITGTTPQTVTPGGNGTAVTAKPDATHTFSSWSDGVTTATRTDKNVTADKSVTASFTSASAPSTPTDLSADTSTTPSSCGNNWLNISWNASTGATSYQVYRDEGATAIYNSSALFFSDTGLTLGSTHTYKVRATNAGGSSALSSSVSGTVAPACAGPTAAPNLTVSASSPTTATVDVAQTYTATITNSGSAAMGKASNYFFQVCSTASQSGNCPLTSTITNKTSSTLANLVAGEKATATLNNTFTSVGTYSMRACADFTSPGVGYVITESNEDDNCGPVTANGGWTNITVSTAPPPNSTPVDGGWSEWNPVITSCPSPLNPIQQKRTCTNPAPANRGLDCVGPLSQSFTSDQCPASSFTIKNISGADIINSIRYNTMVYIAWTSTNATSCACTSADKAGKDVPTSCGSGTFSTSTRTLPLKKSMIYTLSCSGNGMTITDSKTVIVDDINTIYKEN